jgi:hypothetical protein
MALVVAVLALNTAGMPDIFLPEPCGAAAHGTDGDCLPTCILCGCCAQPVIPVRVDVDRSPSVLVPTPGAALEQIVTACPTEILHVPKSFAL